MRHTLPFSVLSLVGKDQIDRRENYSAHGHVVPWSSILLPNEPMHDDAEDCSRKWWTTQIGKFPSQSMITTKVVESSVAAQS